MRPRRGAALAILAMTAVIASAAPAEAGSKWVTEPPDADEARANRYAALDDTACLSLLKWRGVPFKQVPETKGVDTPVRLAGPVRGVRFRPVESLRPEDDDPKTIADCRLALALDDLARLLRSRGVVAVAYYSMYRARGAGRMKRGMRHPGARAMDWVSVTLAGGATFTVREDFHGRIGAATCGEDAMKPARDTEGARLWRSTVCEIGARRSFNLILTPDHDFGHRDHIHVEVRSGIRWFLIH